MDPLAQHAALALSGEPDLAVPLPRLHSQLRARLGTRTSDLAHLRRVLERHPDAFRILEPAPPTWHDAAWTDDARARYDSALRAVGMEPATPLALLVREPEPSQEARTVPMVDTAAEALLRRLDATLIGLCSGANPPARLVQALGRVEVVRRVLRNLGKSEPVTLTRASAASTTIPAPDPPP